jgi:hypothetical protein
MPVSLQRASPIISRLGGCQPNSFQCEICSVRDFSNLYALYFICFGVSFSKESRICLHTQDVQFIKPWREYQMTFLFYDFIFNSLAIRGNPVWMSLPSYFCKKWWVPIEFQTCTSTVVSIKPINNSSEYRLMFIPVLFIIYKVNLFNFSVELILKNIFNSCNCKNKFPHNKFPRKMVTTPINWDTKSHRFEQIWPASFIIY